MKLALTLSSAAVVVASPAPDVAIKFGIDEGTKVEKKVVHEAIFEFVSGVQRRGNEEIQMPDEYAMSLEHVRSMTVVDVYGASADGVPGSLVRTVTEFEDTLTWEIVEESDRSEKVDVQLESELEDVPVAWSPEDGTYVASYVEEDNDLRDELLDGLTFDLDGFGLLPPAGADLTEGWEVPAGALGELLQFGGSLSETATEAPSDAGQTVLRGVMLLPLLGDLEGDATLVLESYDEEKGLAKITIEVEATSEASAIDLVQSIGKDIGGDRMQQLEDVLLETELDLNGAIQWDVRAGRLAHLEMDGDCRREMTIKALDPGGGPGPVIQLAFEAEASWIAEFQEK